MRARWVGLPAAEIEAAVVGQLRALFRQPEIIVGTWRAARAERENITEDEAREALLQLDPLWEELFPAEQARTVQLLVERVDVQMEGVRSGCGRTDAGRVSVGVGGAVVPVVLARAMPSRYRLRLQVAPLLDGKPLL